MKVVKGRGDSSKVFSTIALTELKRIRKSLGLTQQAVATEAGLSRVTISALEKAQDASGYWREARYETAEKVADALGVSVSDLAGTEVPDRPPKTRPVYTVASDGPLGYWRPERQGSLAVKGSPFDIERAVGDLVVDLRDTGWDVRLPESYEDTVIELDNAESLMDSRDPSGIGSFEKVVIVLARIHVMYWFTHEDWDTLGRIVRLGSYVGVHAVYAHEVGRHYAGRIPPGVLRDTACEVFVTHPWVIEGGVSAEYEHAMNVRNSPAGVSR